ncbi:MAG: FecR domain-containing protein [Tannerella sp.]|jgi:ferric-dicitrate binding protein FerR (iron transport regulator)|nr:FecR domain-containing protein [Tannerella sp.]
MDELIQKYIDGSLTQAEKLELLRQAQNDAQLRAELARHKNLNAIINLKRQEGDRQCAAESYRRFSGEHKKRKQTVWQILAYAATAACLIGLTWWLSGMYYHSKIQTQEKFNTLYVPAGQRVQFTLEDGTGVWLNAQTKLTYPIEFKGNERHVEVEGEAYFEVTKDASRPFVVSSKDFNIKVLGTKFNIYSYPEEKQSRVSLIEGSLNVCNQDVVTLKPKEEAIIEGDRMTVAQIPNQHYFLWTEGIYSFENERFENIVKRLELYYDISIAIENAAMRDWRYTVKFRQRDGIDEILRLMQCIHQFNMIRDNENNKIQITK